MDANFLIFEVNPETGKLEPVQPDLVAAETSGWTTPPEGLPTRQFGLWRLVRKRALDAGQAPDQAWYAATVAAAQAEATFRDKARRRFFRP